jgi:CBS domain-containing protein
MKQALVQSIMTDENIIVASASNTVSEAIHFFANKHLQHLPVLDGDSLIGIISVNDVVHLTAQMLANGESISKEELNQNYSLKDIMTPNPVWVAPDTSIAEALQILVKGNIQCLPICEGGKLVGIISSKDLIKHYNNNENPPHTNFEISTPGFGI